MSDTIFFMSYSAPKHINIGAYEYPYSGVGIEYYPLGGELDHTGLLIHEVGYLPQNQNWNFPSVFSPFWRLYYNSMSGHGINFDNTFYELSPETIMLIPEHQLFHCLGTNPVPCLWMAFSTKCTISPRQTVPILLKPTKTELSLIKDIQKLIEQKPNYKPTNAIYRHCIALLNIVMANADIEFKAVPPDVLAGLLNYAEANLGKNLSNSNLANIACLSIEGLSKMFRKYMEISPAAYVTHMRIKEAGRLLSQSKMTIEQIALTTGFPNRNYFSRVFKKNTDKSPAEFRRLYQQAS
jgi:AraC family transcriptional regulator of arabinose operon